MDLSVDNAPSPPAQDPEPDPPPPDPPPSDPPPSDPPPTVQLNQNDTFERVPPKSATTAPTSQLAKADPVKADAPKADDPPSPPAQPAKKDPAPAPTKAQPALPPDVVRVNRATGEKSTGPAQPSPPQPPPDPAKAKREAEDKALASLPSHATMQMDAQAKQRIEEQQQLDEWKRQKAEKELRNPRLNTRSCIDGRPRPEDQPPLRLSGFGQRGMSPTETNAEIDRRFGVAAKDMSPLDRANLADRYANKLAPAGSAKDNDTVGRFLLGYNPEDGRKAADAFRVREADRLRTAAGAGGVSDTDRTAMKKRADDLVTRPITGEERAGMDALKRADVRTISKNDAGDGLAMLDRIRPADADKYAKGSNIKQGTERLFLSDPEINHMFDANIWREDKSFEKKIPAYMLGGGEKCYDCHPKKKEGDFKLSLRGFDPSGDLGSRGGALTGTDRDALRAFLDGKGGGAPLGGKGGAAEDKPAPKIDTDPTGTAIERYMARDPKWGTLTPDKRADKSFMEKYDAEKSRLRAEDKQRQEIFANPADPTKRLRTPYEKLSADDQRIVDDHKQLYETRQLEQKLGPHYQKLQDEYRKNGWGDDSRFYGVDSANFMRELAEKDPAKISRYDAFRGLRTADEYRKQNPDVFAKNPANFEASREKATSLYYKNLDEMRAAKVDDIAAREAAIKADPNNPIGYLKTGLGGLSPEQNEIVMRDYSRYSIDRLEQKLRGQTVSGIGEQVTSLDRHFARMVDQQGVVGSGANWLKNHIGSDGGWIIDSNLGSDAVQNTIQNAYLARDQVNDLKNFKGTHEEFLKAYDERLKNLGDKLGDVRTHMQRFQGSQRAWVDGIADVTSTMAAIGGAALAPVTGGASLAVGIGIGAAVKVGVKGLDAVTGSGQYDGNIFVDTATGGLNGLTGAGSMMATKKAGEMLLKRAAVGLAEGETIPWLTRAGIFLGTRGGIGAADGFVNGTGSALIKGEEDPLGKGLRGAAVGAVMFPLGEGAMKGVGKLWKTAVRPSGLPDFIETNWKGQPIDGEGKLLNLTKNWKGEYVIPDNLKPSVQAAGARATGDPVVGDPAPATTTGRGAAAAATATPAAPASAASVTNEEVLKAINGQLKVLAPGDIDKLVQRFPAELQDQARQVLARSSGYGGFDSLNDLRKAMDPYLQAGGKLYTPGSGSLGDNMAYLSGKGNFKGVTADSGARLPTSDTVGRNSIVLLDDVALNRIRTDPAFAQSLIDNNATLLSPRGFNDGLNMFNSPTIDSMASRTQSILDSAARIQQSGGAKTIDEAITKALDENTMSVLRNANPALAGRVKMIDGANLGTKDSNAIAARLNGNAGMTQADLDAVINKLPERYRDTARQLLADQAQVYSPRRIAQDLIDQHKRIMDQAAAQGIDPKDVYFYIPQGNKSYGTMAMAHRQATGTPVDHYINGVDDLTRRGLGSKTALAVLDDVAGTGDSLQGAAYSIDASRYAGKVYLAPMVSTTEAQSLLGTASATRSYLPGRVIDPLAETSFYKGLDPKTRDLVRMMLGDWGYGNNGLSVSFPYMAPDNNNHFFGDLVAPFFIINRNAAASKSTGYIVPTR